MPDATMTDVVTVREGAYYALHPLYAVAGCGIIMLEFVGSVRARSGKCCWKIAIFLGGFPTAFCKTEIKNDQNVIRFFESDAQSGQAIGTPGGIRTHGLPLRSFCWACALAFV